MLSVFINGAARRMGVRTCAEHEALLALSPPQGPVRRQTQAASGDHHHALLKGPRDGRAPVPWAGRGLVLDASPTDLYQQRPSPVLYFINLCAWPPWQAYVCHIIEFVCLVSEDIPRACFLPHDSHPTPNFSLPPCSGFAWVAAVFLFKSSRSKRGEEDLRSMCGKVQYCFYLSRNQKM